MFDRKLLEKELARDEGKRLSTYEDSLGFKTIGIGHLQENQREDITITETECEALLQKDIEVAIKRLNTIYPGWINETDARQRALLNMTFNLGGKLAGFKRFLARMRGGLYESAAKEMLDSLWAKQVGQRAVRLSEMIERG